MASLNLETGESFEQLTAKEREVLDQLLQHKSLKRVALDLGISHRAVEERLRTARIKLGAADRHEATRTYAAVLATCGKTTCGFSQMGNVYFVPQSSIGDEGTQALLALRDSGIVAMPPLPDEPWERASIPEAFDERFGRFWRLLAIPALAVTVSVLALALVAMARTLGEIL